jgi:hypothetical protein
MFNEELKIYLTAKLLEGKDPREAEALSNYFCADTAVPFTFMSTGAPNELLMFGKDLMRAGVFRLPYPACLFRWPNLDWMRKTQNVDVDGRLVNLDDKRLFALVFPYDEGEIGVIAMSSYRRDGRVKYGFMGAGVIDVTNPDAFWPFESGDIPFMRHMGATPEMDAIRNEQLAHVVGEVIASVAALGCPGVVDRVEPAPTKLNKRRAAKGAPPILERHVVIIPDATKFRHERSGGGEHRASPRPHWRRGHIRHNAWGTISVVKPCPILGGGERKSYVVQ